MFLFAYGAQIAYLVVIADSVPRVADLLLPNSFFTNRHYALLFFAILVILPLCLLRDLSSLSWTSLLSVSSNVILILMIIITVPTVEDNSHNEDKFEASNIFAISYSLFIGIGTMSFAFVCQHNSFIVFRSLATPTFAAWKTVARNSILIAFIICLCFALVGFITFYPNVDGDLLNNFPNNYVTIAIARGLIATGMVFTYPMECFVTRHCIGSLISREQVLSEKGNNQSKKDRHGSRKLNNFIKNQRSSRHVYGSGVYSRTGTVMDGEDGEDDYVENTNRATSGFVELDDTKSDEEEVIEFNQFGGNSDGNRLSSEERDGEGSGIDTEENGGVHLSTTQHVIITLLLWGSSLGIAMIADELGIVLALTGECLLRSCRNIFVDFVLYLMPNHTASNFPFTYDA